MTTRVLDGGLFQFCGRKDYVCTYVHSYYRGLVLLYERTAGLGLDRYVKVNSITK